MGTCLVRNTTIRCCFRRSYSFTTAEALPSHAKVVICGGGVQGAALGYFLAQHGWGKDTLILDQGKIGRATPWHMSGLVYHTTMICIDIYHYNSYVKMFLRLESSSPLQQKLE